MRRPFRIPGGWLGVFLVCLGPTAIIAVAVKGQIDDVGVWEAVGKALLLMATGPILYPIARWWKLKNKIPDDPTLNDTGDAA